jgi:hypothetical protein
MGYEVQVTIVGTAPLLQHRYRFKDELEEKTTRKTGRHDYTDEWKQSLYVDDSGGIYEPASHIEGALIRAASNFQITGRGKKTYRELVRSSVFVAPDAIPLGKEKPDFIHKARVIVNRSAVERLRPAFRVWELTFTLSVLDEQLPKEVLQQILEHAGRACGIGDYRPRYGRFRIARFE